MQQPLKEDLLPPRSFKAASRSGCLPPSVLDLTRTAWVGMPRASALLLLLQALDGSFIWLYAATAQHLLHPVEAASPFPALGVAGLLALA